jgi:hypothetical protein
MFAKETPNDNVIKIGSKISLVLNASGLSTFNSKPHCLWIKRSFLFKKVLEGLAKCFCKTKKASQNISATFLFQGFLQKNVIFIKLLIIM